jgi:hypothetical protein
VQTAVSSSPLATATQAPITFAAPVGDSVPVVPQSIRQYFLPVSDSARDFLYKPTALGFAQMGFRDTPTGIQASRDFLAASPIMDDVFPVNWDNAVTIKFDINDLEQSGPSGAQFAAMPAAAALEKNYPAWSKEFAAWIYRTQRLELFKSPMTKEVSLPDESERDFRLRLEQDTREGRDREVEQLRQKYAVKMNALNEKIRKSEQAVEREKSQASQQKMQTAISFGATILSSFLGKKVLSASSLGRATTAIRGASRTLKENGDVNRTKETVEAYKAQLQDLEEAFSKEAEALSGKMDPTSMELTKLVLRPAKTDILVKMMALAWLPYSQKADGTLTPAWE